MNHFQSEFSRTKAYSHTRWIGIRGPNFCITANQTEIFPGGFLTTSFPNENTPPFRGPESGNRTRAQFRTLAANFLGHAVSTLVPLFQLVKILMNIYARWK